MAWYLVFWRNRSTATVVPAASAAQARRRANDQDSRLIRKGVWVRRRLDGSGPQFGSARSRARARRQRSGCRHWLPAAGSGRSASRGSCAANDGYHW
jgi:hypothetical protein